MKNPTYHPGFFSALFTIIGFLDDFDKEGWQGIVIDFENQGNYYEPKKGSNWWGYYFKPISEKPTWKYDEWCVVEDLKMSYGFKTLFRSRSEVFQTTQKYIRPVDEVTFEVDTFADIYFGRNSVVGVNYQRPEKINNRLKPPNFQNFFDRIDLLLKEENHASAKIFVSTDDSRFLDELIDRYGSKIVYRDVPRGDDIVPAAYYSTTPNYDKGFDEIVECLLLSKCDVIVRTNTNITTAAGFFNPGVKIITIKSLAVPGS